MEAEGGKLGGSLPVPCVQELAKEAAVLMGVVPPRYLRQPPPPSPSPAGLFQTHDHPHDHDQYSSSSTTIDQVPVIDMQQLLLSGDDDHSSSSSSELHKLHLACTDWGFFQLINHGVSSVLVEKVKSETHDFFNMPMEVKKKFWQEPGNIQGFGQAFVVSEDQKLDWADLFYLVTLPRSTRLPRLFPQLPLPFRNTLDAYSTELKGLALKILMQMAKALDMDVQDMTVLFEEGMQGMRMNYYPPCPKPEQVIGLTPHSDAVGLTILLQLNEMQGLQIKKNGQWIPVKPLPNAFIINIGDILEIITNGIYPSIEHRATVNSQKERLSIATFYSPKLDSIIGPAPSLTSPESPPLFKTISTSDYFKGLFSRELDAKSYLDVMRVQEEKKNS